MNNFTITKMGPTGLHLRTQVRAGYQNLVKNCDGLFITTDNSPKGNVFMRGTCLDLKGLGKPTALTFPKSYKGPIVNCDGVLTKGGCG